MKFNVTVIAVILTSQFFKDAEAGGEDAKNKHLSMIGNANLIHHPDIQTAVTELAKKKSRRALKRSKKSKKGKKKKKKKKNL